MADESASKHRGAGPRPGSGGVIELKLRDVNQLFNSMDPSPFPERDLDADAEEFIVSWALELPRHAPLELFVHLAESPTKEDPAKLIESGIHTYFGYRADMTRRQLRKLLGQGRVSLVVGLVFLTACLGAADLLGHLDKTPFMLIVRESLLIGGWVAMWRPMEIFLYDWWPLRHQRRVYRRLSKAKVRVVQG